MGALAMTACPLQAASFKPYWEARHEVTRPILIRTLIWDMEYRPAPQWGVYVRAVVHHQTHWFFTHLLATNRGITQRYGGATGARYYAVRSKEGRVELFATAWIGRFRGMVQERGFDPYVYYLTQGFVGVGIQGGGRWWSLSFTTGACFGRIGYASGGVLSGWMKKQLPLSPVDVNTELAFGVRLNPHKRR